MEEKIAAEADTLYAALDEIAGKLGLTRDKVDYSFDASHFRENNRNKPVDTVRVLGWKKPEQDLTGVHIGTNWLNTLFSLLNIEVTISHKLSENNVALKLASEKGALIVGRKGSTLRAIQEVFFAAMKKEAPDWVFRLDVAGKREDRRRDGRRGRRDDRRDDRRGRDKRKNTSGLEKLAKQLARKAIEGQEEIVMRQTLNAFERRIVHQVVNAMDGVQTESFMDDDVKRIRIKPLAAEE